MHFIREGRGAPALVFVHGFACSLEDWSAQIDFFGATNEVVACDLRGHGKTPGRPHECTIEHYGGDVAALVDNLELKGPILIGHSMGCRVVLEAASLIPDTVAGLVLVDGSRIAIGDRVRAEATADAAIDKLGYPAFAENLFRNMFFKSSALADRIVARAVRSSADFGPALWPSMAGWDAAKCESALAAVRCPVLAIQSTTRDPATNRRAPLRAGESTPWLDTVKDKIPGARIEIVPDTGHFTMLEQSAEVNRLISQHLRLQ